jgi:intracellular multiplication protein IcmB
MDVSPQGDETADRQTSIMYMLARHALVRSWWMSMDSLRSMPEKYRPYHEKRLQDIGETPKRLCYDEFHRTSSSKAVRGQLIRDVREGRKRGVQIVLASQLLDDFDDDMVDLATGVWILGTAISDRSVDRSQETFGLSDTARQVIRHHLTGPRSSGGPALFVLGTTDGRYEQHLINTLGPIELWALSTSAEDVAIRNRLYTRLGAGRGRQMLAASFPGGSARSEIKRRVFAKAESGQTQSAATSAVVEEIVEELVALSQKQEREEREREILENLE